MYKTATRSKIRFMSNRGYLLTEDLWDLPLVQLNSMAKDLRRKLKECEEEDFLEETTPDDAALKLRFDIVLDVLNTLKGERKEAADEVTKKAEKQKILELLAKKQDEALGELSEEELLKKLDEIG